MKIILLIHGSWHGAWCWYKVAPKLRSLGYRVLVPDLPGHGKEWRFFRGKVTLREMEKAVLKCIDRYTDPVVVVAHSRYGILASRLAELRPNRIEKSVYLAAYLLPPGARAYDYFLHDKESLLNPAVEANPWSLTDRIPQSVYRSALYADCDDCDVELARSLLLPEPSLPALTRLKLTEHRYGRVPRFYIQLTEDRAVSLSLQNQFLSKAAVQRIYSLSASHSAYFSKAQELTGIVHEIAQTPTN